MALAQVNDIELYYECHGEGEPVILIPGFGNGLWIWFKQIPVFARHFRTIAYDPRGVSRSEKPSGTMSINMLASDVAGLMTALQIESAHIVGASFGGFVAQEFALAYPEKVRSLTLCCTSFGGPGHIMPSQETLQAMASTKLLNTEERVRKNLLLAFSPSYLENEKDEVQEIIGLRAENPVPEHVYLQQLQAAMAFTAEARLSAIKAPTLIITGDVDIIVRPENSINLAARIPHAETRVVAGGSHTFFIERASEFNEIVCEYISSHTRSATVV
jgi:pimeloyl-ACP methyl ester carboxylesterase